MRDMLEIKREVMSSDFDFAKLDSDFLPIAIAVSISSGLHGKDVVGLLDRWSTENPDGAPRHFISWLKNGWLSTLVNPSVDFTVFTPVRSIKENTLALESYVFANKDLIEATDKLFCKLYSLMDLSNGPGPWNTISVPLVHTEREIAHMFYCGVYTTPIYRFKSRMDTYPWQSQ